MATARGARKAFVGQRQSPQRLLRGIGVRPRPSNYPPDGWLQEISGVSFYLRAGHRHDEGWLPILPTNRARPAPLPDRDLECAARVWDWHARLRYRRRFGGGHPLDGAADPIRLHARLASPLLRSAKSADLGFVSLSASADR